MAFVAGFVIDCMIGDPQGWPHPIRLIGFLINKLTDYYLRRADLISGNCDITDTKRKFGVRLVVIVVSLSVVITGIILIFSYTVNSFFGFIIETVMTYQLLAAKSLYTESMKVYEALENSNLQNARKAVSMIVGRDTANLDKSAIARAAVETVAENTSDGVIAPMIYLAIGGPMLGIAYKAINTMDSMVGYKNDRFIDFGRAAARLDDIVNYIPARVSAFFAIVSSFILGREYDGAEALRIFNRDRHNHSSPNSAQTESVFAGALRLRLAGPSSYFGKTVPKPYIGDDIRPIRNRDIILANRLMYCTSVICELMCVIIMILLM